MTLDPRRPFTALVVAALFTASSPIAWAQHDGHQGSMDAPAQAQEPAGDPYPLDIDPVTEDKLPELAQQIIVDHQGRELRFGSTDSVEAFKKNPGGYLAAVDARIARQQLPYYPLDTCVVSGDKLGGAMGDAVDFVYKNRLVRLCCPGCKGEFKDNAADFLGKLDEAVTQRQRADYPLTTCPVSGGELGSMGDPIDVVIANRLVRLCCEGCIDKLRSNPTKYLGMLGGAGAEHANHQDGEDHSKHDSRNKGKERGHSDHSGHNH